MKRKFYSIVTLLLTLMISVFSLIACDKGHVKAEIVSQTDSMVVIKVNEAEGFATLLDAMNYLKNEGELAFEITGGMVTSIEGKANPADWSSCWMVYTSDTEMANAEYTVEYNGNIYGQAILGAESLPIIADAYYVWSYDSFEW